ncbi:MAG: serine/threonine protein kinase [Chloroflexaceae bacterium]|nr:serine/threonine protein kinase [Chloroflexaceae bacterium]
MSEYERIGHAIGIYEIHELIGQGGMATVYRGYDPNLERPVAIKILSDKAATQPEFVERFHREARILGKLRHPNIVQVYMLGQTDAYTYMVQELLPGPSLERYLQEVSRRNEHISRQDLISTISQIAHALDAAHQQGIIHRDVKPANIMWNAVGEVVLTDFGIAKQLHSDANQTQANIVMGTPNYLSPEQAQGLPVTHYSDIYGLGIVLYQMIAGRVPFNSDTPMGVVLQHIQSMPPSLRPFRPDIPPTVEAVVQRALAKNPKARFNSAGEMARVLKRAWPPVTTPNMTVVPTDVHNQTTTYWRRTDLETVPFASSAEQATMGVSQATLLENPMLTSPTAVQYPSRMLLLVLSVLVTLLLLGGVALAFGG